MKVALIGVAAFLLTIIVSITLAGGPAFVQGVAWLFLALGALVISVFAIITVAVVDAAARSYRKSQSNGSDKA